MIPIKLNRIVDALATISERLNIKIDLLQEKIEQIEYDAEEADRELTAAEMNRIDKIEDKILAIETEISDVDEASSYLEKYCE